MTWYMLVFKERDKDLIWPNRAAPRAWLEDGKITEINKAPTQWGKINYRIKSHISTNYISAAVDFEGYQCELLKINLRLRHPKLKKMRAVTVNDKEWNNLDTKKEIITIPCSIK